MKSESRKPSLKHQIGREVQNLVAIYRLHVGKQPFIGGSQNLVKFDVDSDRLIFDLAPKVERHNGNEMATFDSLPVRLQFEIFLTLSGADLCRCSRVCRNWQLLTSDDFIWNRILKRESRHWSRIYSNRNPDLYRSFGFSSKQIYLQCHPRATGSQSTLTTAQFFLHHYLTMFRPRIVMFGPGLERESSKIVRSILTDRLSNDSYRFIVTGLVAGEFSGIGSGISLKLDDQSFNLITLYSNSKSIRRQMNGENRVEQNKLFMHRTEHQQTYELQPAIQELCKHSHGLVYVIDRTQSFHEVASCQSELSAMTCPLWTAVSVPLLILACNRGYSEDLMSAVDVVRALRLGRIGRKWLVQTGEVESLIGIREGISWLLHQV